jgi:hypothetical protein
MESKIKTFIEESEITSSINRIDLRYRAKPNKGALKGHGCRLEGVNIRFKTFTSGLTNTE